MKNNLFVIHRLTKGNKMNKIKVLEKVLRKNLTNLFSRLLDT